MRGVKPAKRLCMGEVPPGTLRSRVRPALAPIATRLTDLRAGEAGTSDPFRGANSDEAARIAQHLGPKLRGAKRDGSKAMSRRARSGVHPFLKPNATRRLAIPSAGGAGAHGSRPGRAALERGPRDRAARFRH